MSPPIKRFDMFRHLRWWEIPFFLLFYPLLWVEEQLERLSWRIGDFLDEWLPHLRVRTSRNSRLGRFLIVVTQSFYPTLCETFWGTVARPFRARAMHWVYLLGGILVGALGILLVGMLVYTGIRDYGVGTTAKWAGIVFGVFIAAEAMLLLIVGTARFAAEHLCPVKFEVTDNSQNGA